MKEVRRRGQVVAIVLALALTSGCAKYPDIKTNPVGAVAAYGLKVIEAVRSVQAVVIAAEGAKLIPTDAAVACVTVTRELGLKAQELAKGLQALEAAGSNDLSKQALLGQVGITLRAMNRLVVQVIIPVDNVELRGKLGVVLEQLSSLLLDVSGKLGI